MKSPRFSKQPRQAGAVAAGYVTLRLPFAVKDLFEDWLGRHLPDRKEKVLGRLRSLRDGKLNDAHFGSRMRGGGPLADAIKNLFDLACRQTGLDGSGPGLSSAHFRRPNDGPTLFDALE